MAVRKRERERESEWCVNPSFQIYQGELLQPAKNKSQMRTELQLITSIISTFAHLYYVHNLIPQRHTHTHARAQPIPK